MNEGMREEEPGARKVWAGRGPGMGKKKEELAAQYCCPFSRFANAKEAWSRCCRLSNLAILSPDSAACDRIGALFTVKLPIVSQLNCQAGKGRRRGGAEFRRMQSLDGSIGLFFRGREARSRSPERRSRDRGAAAARRKPKEGGSWSSSQKKSRFVMCWAGTRISI